MIFPMSTQSTDARDMVKDFSSTFQSSFGCNTEGIMTSEKQVGARMETNEIGSQAQAQFKEVMCNTKILTESQACQKNMDGNEKEVSCMILRPEDLKMIPDSEENLEDLPDCFRCDGSKINKKGLPCKKCNATGKLRNKFFKDLNKILKSEVNKYCTTEYQRLMIEHLEKKKADQSKVVHHGCACDGCNVEPIVGIRYKCTFRENFDLCEKCEAIAPQMYPMLKIRHPSKAPAFLQCQYNSPPNFIHGANG